MWGIRWSFTESNNIHLAFTSFFLWAANSCGSTRLGTTPSTHSLRSFPLTNMLHTRCTTCWHWMYNCWCQPYRSVKLPRNSHMWLETLPHVRLYCPSHKCDCMNLFRTTHAVVWTVLPHMQTAQFPQTCNISLSSSCSHVQPILPHATVILGWKTE